MGEENDTSRAEREAVAAHKAVESYKRRKKGRDAAGGCLVLIVGTVLFVWWCAPDDEPPVREPTVAEAAQIEKEKAARARKAEAENKACRQDLQCTWKKMVNDWNVTIACKGAIERLAQYRHEWTAGFLTRDFTHSRWKEAGRVITLIGDKLELQTGFGAWQPHVYECDVEVATHRPLNVRAQPGRL